MFKEITKDNWLLFAQHNYDNPTLEKQQEFYDDIKRFKYLKRLFRKYETTGDLKIRLVLNHIILLYNVFGSDACMTLLLFKIDKVYWPILKTICGYLGYLYPHELKEVDEDQKIRQMLKEL
jgi:hypothetical protein